MADKSETIVVIGVNYWGKGKTLDEAKREFRKAGGSLSKGYMIVTFSPDQEFCGIDDMGRYTWKGDTASPAKKVVAGTQVKAQAK